MYSFVQHDTLFPFVLVDLESLHSDWLTGVVHDTNVFLLYCPGLNKGKVFSHISGTTYGVLWRLVIILHTRFASLARGACS